jgi:hypothetical protein
MKLLKLWCRSHVPVYWQQYVLLAKSAKHQFCDCCCCLQVQAALNIILDRAAQTVAEHAKAGQQQQQDQGTNARDAAVAAKWAAANPPGSCGFSSSSSSDGKPLQLPQGDGEAQDSPTGCPVVSSGGLCVHYYSPRVHASMCEVYSQARALLAPPPPPVEPPKKGETPSDPSRTLTSQADVSYAILIMFRKWMKVLNSADQANSRPVDPTNVCRQAQQVWLGPRPKTNSSPRNVPPAPPPK